MPWLRMNTHTHTCATWPVPEGAPDRTAEWYRDHGYQALVLTEHETVIDVDPLNAAHGRDDFLLLRGQEITQGMSASGHPGGVRHFHVNAVAIDAGPDRILPVGIPDTLWDVPEAIAWPSIETTTPTDLYRHNFAAVRGAGGIPQVNHPNFLWSVTPDDLLPLEGPFLMEVWNAFPHSNNLGGVGDDGATAISTEELWDVLLTAGTTVWATATDDSHDYEKFDHRDEPTPGKGWIVVDAERLTLGDIRESLRTGRFYASTGIELARVESDGAELRIEIVRKPEWANPDPPSTRYTTRFVGAGGEVLAVLPGARPSYRFRGDEQYVRASITDSDGRRAWVQPTILGSVRPPARADHSASLGGQSTT